LFDLFLNLEMPLSSILAEMERVGVLVDREALKTLSNEIGPEIDQLAPADLCPRRQELQHPLSGAAEGDPVPGDGS
jgi:DNA polymerase I-like protein with 3'-5' exonuclease and polymerase domains